MRIIVLLMMMVTLAFAGLKNVDKQYLPVNILTNPGFENDKAGWSNTGSSTLTADTTTELIGSKSMKWDPSASGEYMQSADITIPKGLLSGNCEVGFTYQWDSGTAGQIQLQVLDGSDNVLVQTTDSSGTDPLAVTSSGSRGFKRLNFSCPSSGTIQFNLYSNANAAEITVDGLWLGEARNVGSVDGGTLYGSLTWAPTTNCAWTGSSATLANFAADADCDDNVRVAVGKTTSAVAAGNSEGQIPQIKFASMPAGEYLIVARGKFFTYVSSGSAAQGVWAFSDGTDNTQLVNQLLITGTTANYIGDPILSGRIRYETAQNNVTIQLQQDLLSGTEMSIDAGTEGLEISVYRFPLASETTYNLDTTAMAWSGAHSSTCTWTSTAGSFSLPTGDATCDLTETINRNFGTVASVADGTGNQPAITFTPKKTGIYKVCAAPYYINNNTSGASAYIRLYDATNSIDMMSAQLEDPSGNTNQGNLLCGLTNITSISSTEIQLLSAASAGTMTYNLIYWHIYPITQNLPMPTIMNSVVSPDSDGVRTCSGLIANTGSASVTRSDGDCISGVTRSVAGVTLPTFASGTFSSAPNCFATATGNGFVMRIPTVATTGITVYSYNPTTLVATDISYFVECKGKK